MDQQLYLLGAGRHPRTKSLRATQGHKRRTFYIGELHVTSGKRLPVTVEWARMYYDTIVGHIKAGTLLLHFAGDTFVDPEELRVLCFGTAEELAAYTEEALAAEPSTEPAAEATPAAENAPAPVAEPEVVIQGPAVVNATPAAEPPTDLEPESQVILPPEPETAAVEAASTPEVTLSPEPESEPAAEPEVAAETTEESPADEEAEETTELESTEPVADTALAATSKPLPEGWRHFNKAKLSSLALELGIDISDMPSNRELIGRIGAKEA